MFVHACISTYACIYAYRVYVYCVYKHTYMAFYFNATGTDTRYVCTVYIVCMHDECVCFCMHCISTYACIYAYHVYVYCVYKHMHVHEDFYEKSPLALTLKILHVCT